MFATTIFKKTMTPRSPMLHSVLQELGFTRNEVSIYAALLETGQSSVATLAVRSGMHRRNVYDTTASLMRKGLVSRVMVDGRRTYRAAHPRILRELLEVRGERLGSAISQLEAKHPRIPPSGIDVRVHTGKDGLKMVLLELLKSGKPLEQLATVRLFSEVLPFFYPAYQRRKLKAGVGGRAIFSEAERDAAAMGEFVGRARFLPHEFRSLATTIVCGGRVVLISWVETPIAVIISNAEISTSFHDYFEFLWGIAKP